MERIKRISSALNRKASILVLTVTTFAYLALYLSAIRHLSLTSTPTGITTTTLSRAFESTGFLQYEPVAQIVINPISLLISPLNILIGLFLGFLVGINTALLYIVIKQPDRCDISDTSGILASLPALISGTACCGPIIPIILGIQITGTFITLTKVAIPLSVVLLLITIFFLSNKIHSQTQKSS